MPEPPPEAGRGERSEPGLPAEAAGLLCDSVLAALILARRLRGRVNSAHSLVVPRPGDSGIRGITGSPFGGVRLRPWARASLPAAPRGRRVKKTKEAKASCGRAVRTGKRGLRAGGLEAALRPSHPLSKIPSLKPGSGHE